MKTSRHRLPRIVAAAAAGAVALAGLALPTTALASAVSSSWLDGYFNNTGIGDAGTDYADIDNLGSYIVRSDGAGVTPDVQQPLGDTGLTFSVAGGVAGEPDNLTASNQTVDTSRGLGHLATTPATKISLVGAATNGSKTATVTLTYSDSSTQVLNAQLSDWCDSTAQGTNVRVATWPQRWYNGSAQQLACGLWRTEVYTLEPTTPGATLESITFGNQPNFHVFAIASDAVVNAGAITLTGTGTPSVTPTSAQYGSSGVTLTVSGAPTWSTTGVTSAWSWTVDDVAVVGAHSTTFSVRASDVGKVIKAVATGRKAGYVSGAVASNAVTVAPGTLAVATAPSASGTPRVGEALTAVGGTYTPAASSVSYVWAAGGVPVAGATASTFTPSAAQVGAQISVTVTASLEGYADKSTTVTVPGTVAKGTFTSTPPAVSGTFAVGQTLTAVPGSYSTTGVASAYQWTAGSTDIVGATSSSYVLTPADLGKVVGVKVVATKSGYDDVTVSATGNIVSAGDITVVSAPALSGDAVVGRTLSVTAGEYSPADATVSYSWSANDAAIPGATAATFVPTTAQVGKALQATVTVARAGYDDLVTVVPAGTVRLDAFTVTKAPVISSATVGKAATVTAGSYSTAGVTVAYQWLVNGKAVKGATAARYTPAASDVNRGLAVRVTATKAGFTAVTSTTAQVTVKAGAITAKKKPAIKNAAKASKVKVGKKLTVSKGTYSVSAVKVTYQWYRGSKKVSGKAGKKATYKVTAKDRKKNLKVKVTVKRSGYKTLTVTTKKTVRVR